MNNPVLQKLHKSEQRYAVMGLNVHLLHDFPKSEQVVSD